jgi:arginyl-tRNA synthetase
MVRAPRRRAGPGTVFTCPVLDADDETAKNSRLKLSALTANIFQEGLQLLGIETLERM